MIELEQAFEADLRGRSAPFLVCLLVVLSASVFDLYPPWFALSLVYASLPLHSASFFPEFFLFATIGRRFLSAFGHFPQTGRLRARPRKFMTRIYHTRNSE